MTLRPFGAGKLKIFLATLRGLKCAGLGRREVNGGVRTLFESDGTEAAGAGGTVSPCTLPSFLPPAYPLWQPELA